MAVTLCENVVIFDGMIVASSAIKCAHNVQWIFNQTNEHCCGLVGWLIRTCMCACTGMSCLLVSMPFLVAVNNCNFTVSKSSFCSVVTSNCNFFFHTHVHIDDYTIHVMQTFYNQNIPFLFILTNEYYTWWCRFFWGEISKFVYVIRFCCCAFSFFCIFLLYFSFVFGWLPLLLMWLIIWYEIV